MRRVLNFIQASKYYKDAIQLWDSILVFVPNNVFIQNQINLAEKRLKTRTGEEEKGN